MQIPSSPIRPLLRKLIVQGLAAVDAGTAVSRAITRKGEELVIGRRRYDLRRYEHVIVVGAGKATASMAQAVEQRLGSRLHGGFVVVKHGHVVPTKRIVVAEAGHPIPDRFGLQAAGYGNLLDGTLAVSLAVGGVVVGLGALVLALVAWHMSRAQHATRR